MGNLGFLALGHFVFDCGFQSHKNSMNLAEDLSARIKHVAVYTALMTPSFWILVQNEPKVVLFASVMTALLHFMIDGDAAATLWAKFVYGAPEFQERTITEGMRLFKASPRGMILTTALDQALHILSLLPVAVYATTKESSFPLWYSVAFGEALHLGVIRLHRLTAYD